MKDKLPHCLGLSTFAYVSQGAELDYMKINPSKNRKAIEPYYDNWDVEARSSIAQKGR